MFKIIHTEYVIHPTIYSVSLPTFIAKREHTFFL